MLQPYPLGAGLAEFAETVTAAGVPAYLDPRDLNPPCAWIEPTSIGSDSLDVTQLQVGVNVHLIAAGGADVPQQLDDLGRMLALLVPVLGAVDATPGTANLPNLSPDPLGALTIPLALDLTP